MKKQLSILIIFLFNIAICSAVERNEFYKVIASGSVAEVDKCIQELNASKPSSKINAYMGTILMKKAALVNNPKNKLDLFSTGAKMLNKEISKEPDNVEYRFLRLIIQEKAPRFLGYHEEIPADKKEILTGYKKLDSFLQKEILDFSKTSKIITEKELQ